MVAPWSYYHWDGTHDHLSSVVKAVTQPGRHSINSHYKSFRPVTASGAPLSVNNSTDFQTVISPTLILQWTVKPFPSSPSFPWLTSSQGCEWRIKPLHRCQTLCYVHFKNTQLHEDKLEGESHSLPPMHAIYTVCWCQCGGNVRGNLNQVDMRYGKAHTNPSGFVFIPCSHACKYSCYHLADWEMSKRLSSPTLPYYRWRLAAYRCHISLWTMMDLSGSHQVMVQFWHDN